MLKLNASPKTVEAVLRIDMTVAGEDCQAGEVVELSAREFKYLETHDRVLVATKENVGIVRAEVARKKDAVAKAASKVNETADLKAQLASARAEIESLKAAKK